jgi:hypothetical protein
MMLLQNLLPAVEVVSAAITVMPRGVLHVNTPSYNLPRWIPVSAAMEASMVEAA